MSVAWVLTTLFLRSSGHFNIDPARRTGVLVRRLQTTPRLLRDLWVTRARLLENVGFWEPEVYTEALEAYEHALSVAQVKHEAEAEGLSRARRMHSTKPRALNSSPPTVGRRMSRLLRRRR